MLARDKTVTRNTRHLHVVLVPLQYSLRDLQSDRLQLMVTILIPVPDLFLKTAWSNLQVADGNQPIWNVLEKPHDSCGSVVHGLIRQLRGQVIIIFNLRDLDVLLMTATELTLHLVDPPREIGQHALNVADVDLFLFKVPLQVSDPLFVMTGELFCLTLLLEIVVKKFPMVVGPPIQGFQVRINLVDKGILHLLELPPFPLQLVMLSNL